MRRGHASSALLAAVLAGFAGCADLPDFAVATVANGPAPALVPLDGLLAQAEPGRATDASQAALAGRAAGLRARAGALRGPVQDAATRARLAAAIAAHPAP